MTNVVHAVPLKSGAVYVDGRSILEKDAPHSVLDIGVSSEMEQRLAALMASEWEVEGLWDSDFRSQIARPLSPSSYLAGSGVRVRLLKMAIGCGKADV